MAATGINSPVRPLYRLGNRGDSRDPAVSILSVTQIRRLLVLPRAEFLVHNPHLGVSHRAVSEYIGRSHLRCGSRP